MRFSPQRKANISNNCITAACRSSSCSMSCSPAKTGAKSSNTSKARMKQSISPSSCSRPTPAPSRPPAPPGRKTSSPNPSTSTTCWQKSRDCSRNHLPGCTNDTGSLSFGSVWRRAIDCVLQLPVQVPVPAQMLADAAIGGVAGVEATELLLGGFQRGVGQHVQARGEVEQGDRRAARAALHAVDKHFHATAVLLLDEVQRLVDHLFTDETRDGQVVEAEHDAVLAARNQVIGVVCRYVAYPVADGHAMIGAAGMHNCPARLARDDGLVIVSVAEK